MPEITVVFTSPAWRAGAQAAIDVALAGGQPIMWLIERRGSEFVAGFNTRWSDISHLTPTQLDAFIFGEMGEVMA